jgi:hypothetical protein
VGEILKLRKMIWGYHCNYIIVMKSRVYFKKNLCNFCCWSLKCYAIFQSSAETCVYVCVCARAYMRVCMHVIWKRVNLYVKMCKMTAVEA